MSSYLCVLLVMLMSQLIPSSAFRFDLIASNDLHSMMEGSGPDTHFSCEQDGDPVRGHYARVAHKIRQLRQQSDVDGVASLLIDGGDFLSGSMYHVIGPSEGTDFTPELEFFDYVGYDAISFGNHEFDASESYLAYQLEKAQSQGLEVNFVATNIIFDRGSERLAKFFSREHSDGTAAWESEIEDEVKEREEGSSPLPEHSVKIWPFVIKTLYARSPSHDTSGVRSYGKKSLRVGIIGLVGPDAALVSAGHRHAVRFRGFDDVEMKLRMQDAVDCAAAKVKLMRETYGVDVVVMTTHMGSPEENDFVGLLGADRVDVIVAGHTHKSYVSTIGDTITAQAGNYGETLNYLRFEWDDGAKRVRLLNPDTALVTIDDSVPCDEHFLGRMEMFKKEISKVLPLMDYSEVVYQKSIDDPSNVFPPNLKKKETSDLVVSLLLNQLNKETSITDPVLVYFTAVPMVRWTPMAVDGVVTLQNSDVFRMLSLGYGSSATAELHRPGSPVVTFYVEKKELWRAINAAQLITLFSDLFDVSFSDSVQYSTRWWGIPFLNRIADLRVAEMSYDELPELVHVGTSTWVAYYLYKLQHMMWPLPSMLPRGQDGKVLDKEALVGEDLHPREFELLSRALSGL